MNQTLPTISFPKGTAFAPMGDELVVEDAHGNAEVIGLNDRGGYSRSIRGRSFGNYATMTDALRSAARDGYAPPIND